MAIVTGTALESNKNFRVNFEGGSAEGRASSGNTVLQQGGGCVYAAASGETPAGLP